jgi:putative two-component system response regulator
MELCKDGRILIVDNSEDSAAFIEETLRKTGYQNISFTIDSRSALQAIVDFRPDLLIIDLYMPPPDGLHILDAIMSNPSRDESMQILCMGAEISQRNKVKAVIHGAAAFLPKPIDSVELLLNVRNLLNGRFLRRTIQRERDERAAVKRTNCEPEIVIARQLLRVFEVLDPHRAENGRRVAEVAAAIAHELDWREDQIEHLRCAAAVFDLGMLAVPEVIRNSREVLSLQERKALKQHAIASRAMFEGLQMARDIAVGHHERWDGGGYPSGARGSNTPIAARIVGIAQTFIALTDDRSYRPAIAEAHALEEIERQAGFAFDPDLVCAFLRSTIAQRIQAPVPV